MFVLSILFGCRPETRFQVKTLKFGKEAYGYQIDQQGMLFIKQEFIPAIPCKKYFANEQHALAIGQLVVKKLEQNESPAIHSRELTERGIDTNCVALPD